MQDTLKEMFADVKAELGDLTAKIRLADGTEHEVIAPSVGLSRASSEQGESDHPAAVIRMLYDDFDAAEIKLRDVVTLVDCWGNEERLRLREITNTGGIMTMMCEAVNG